MNGATVCNTWFKKKAIYKQTWQHPKSKLWHCIDYVIMRKAQCWRCLDVMVKRGAVCNTDHRLVLMKMRIGKKFSKRGCKDKVYQACVLSVLLYGSECWIPLKRHTNKLN